MPRKSKAELVEEGRALTSDIAAVRKQPHNFALLVGKDDVYLAVHRIKKADALRKIAKKDGGGVKGATGVISIEGKALYLSCGDGENPPANLGKLFKKHLKERGIGFKVVLVGADGATIDAGEDDEGSGSEDDTAATPIDASIQAKLVKAYEKLKTPLVNALKVASPEQITQIKKLNASYAKAMKDENFELALKALTALRAEIAKAPSTQRLSEALTDKADPARLAGMQGLLENAIARAGTDADFDKTASPLLRDMRNSLKAAMKGKPSDDVLVKLTAMKKRLDTLFLDRLAKQGHGPQRHEGDVTPEQLTDRAVSGKDPLTGTTTDGVHGGTHKYGRHATKFKDPGDYVDADETIREKQEFGDAKDDAGTKGETRFAVKLPLKDVLGDNYKDKLVGVSRVGPAKYPTGSTSTDFEDGQMIAIYDIKPGGVFELVTMYPNPTT